MPTKRSTPTGEHRDITKALELAKELQQNESFRAGGGFDELIAILDRLDARHSKREKAARPAKKAAKRGSK